MHGKHRGTACQDLVGEGTLVLLWFIVHLFVGILVPAHRVKNT
jgi:hypothetical protein